MREERLKDGPRGSQQEEKTTPIANSQERPGENRSSLQRLDVTLLLLAEGKKRREEAHREPTERRGR